MISEHTAPTAKQHIRSRIAGSIDVSAPGTVFEPANGQRWEVIKGKVDLPQPLQQPAIIVVPGIAGRWFLQVDERYPKARVERIE